MAKDTWTKLRRLLSRAVKGITGPKSQHPLPGGEPRN
jgi:hypothetical protein